MRRRDFLASSLTSAAALASPSVVRAQPSRVLKFVPQADLSILDPIFSIAIVTRNHGYLVFDTLFGVDSSYTPHPQMVEGTTTSQDGLVWELTLRQGLRFHDGEPVLARDAAASVQRWAQRDAFGQALLAATDELSAPTDRMLRFRLKHPFPLLPAALGKPGANMACIMPERLAMTPATTQVTEMIGSGPYRYLANERVSGSFVAYQAFAGYTPRPDGLPDMTSGPKVPSIERIEWHVLADVATAAAALQTGEVDWWEQPTGDLLPLLRGNRDIEIQTKDPAGLIGFIRFNQLLPPFDNPAIRRALLGAVDQDDFMTAVAGDDTTMWRDKVGFFTPGTAMANSAGMDALTGPRDLAKTKQEIIAAGYKGEPITMIAASDFPSMNAMSEVAADMLRKVGFNLDYRSMDWGSMLARLAHRDTPDKGGWNIYCTFTEGVNMINPAAHATIRGNGLKSPGYGWPTAPALESLREAWFLAPTLAEQKHICEQMQLQAFQDVPYIPVGLYYQPTAYRRGVSGIAKGFPTFYGVTKA
jgi:peptide/nickel transport system substrate-binding protein